MKIFVYSYREFDEAEFFQKFSKEYGVELGICKDAPTLENAHLAEGYEYLSIITTKIDAQLVERFHELGVKMISTRTIGFDHIDLAGSKKIRNECQQCILLTGMCGRLYADADADGNPQNEEDHAESGDQ